MFKPIQFRPEVESLVRFVEETDPDAIVEQALSKLRSGTTVKDLITANTLAVVRSTEVPPLHHGGPVHPVCAVYAVTRLAERLPGELSYLPVIQHTTVCNNHAHSPQMGPYVMPELAPLEGSPAQVGTYHISDEALGEALQPATRLAADPAASTREAFERSVRAMQAPAAEHYFLWLLERSTPAEALDLLLPLAIARNNMDDHNFIYPVYTARAVECVGQEWASVLYRPAVRYQARHHAPLVPEMYKDFASVEALLDEYKLLDKNIPSDTSEAETDAIGELGMRIGRSKNYFDTIEPMAAALANGLSLEGAGEALSVGAAAAYLSTSYGNPMDSHLHTGTHNRRYLLRQPGVSQRNKLLALMTGLTGPEVLLAEPLMNWDSNIDAGITSALPRRSQEQLLDVLIDSIEGQPWLDWRAIGVDQVVAPDEVKETVALARQYADCGYDPVAYFDRLAEISCRDDFTELHSVKHFQAIADEFYATREPFRWLHLVSAAKSAAVTHVGKEHEVYRRTKALLAA